jgi:iron complex outermembrane receptor protein
LEELDFALGLAYDRSTYPLTGDKPGMDALDELGGRLGVSALFADGGLVVHASVNRRARFPSPRELYSGALNRFTPNPDLRPEILLGTEAGVTRRDSKGSLQVVGFLQRLDDAVVRIREAGMFKRVNQDGQRSIGAEFVGSRRFGGLSLAANLTAQSVEFEDPDATLEHPENQPELVAGLGADLDIRRGFRLGASVRYTGEQFALDPDTGILTTLSAGTQLDLDLRRDWRIGSGSGWVTTLGTMIAVDNLTDEALFDAYGLPGPGRLFRFELRLQ